MRITFLMSLILLIAMLPQSCSSNVIPPVTPPQNGGNEPPGDDGRWDDDKYSDYLGDGHPIEGINYRRNNRSQYQLPDCLTADDFITPFSYEEYYEAPDDIIDNRRFHSLVISGDEKLYLGRYLYYYKGFSNEIRAIWESTETSDLSSFYFDENSGTYMDGGQKVILTSRGVMSYSRKRTRDASRSSAGPPVNESSVVNYSYFLKYGVWPELLTSSSENWGIYYFTYGDYDFGDWSSRRFKDFLPLPDDRILVSFTRDDNLTPNHLQVLDGALDVLHELEFPGEITGLTFYNPTACSYISTTDGLYCFDLAFGEMWNTTSNVPGFTDNIPVIADDGSLTGCLDGVLRRISPDGALASEQHCCARIRPVILNDGTIAVITESTIKYFDDDLNETGEIPLPSGTDTGTQYIRPPLVDAGDNMALFNGSDLYIIDRDGNLIAERTFDDDIRETRLGPEHLFVALDYAIYRFPS